MASNGPLFAVGSRNPVKIACVEDAVAGLWPDARVTGLEVESGVAAQPWGYEHGFAGAKSRAEGALAKEPAATHGVGIEGAILDDPDGMWAYAWVVIVDRSGRIGRGKTGHFLLPPEVARMIRDEGLELGEADDRFFGRSNSKHKEGAIGLLSDGRITRAGLYSQGVVFALLPFLHPEYYPEGLR